MPKVLEAKGLDFSYEDGPVLEGVDFHVGEGELVALVGENGAGKSTLMRLVLGELEPKEGEVLVFGQQAAARMHYGRTAYVSQDSVRGYRHFPTTIAELVAVHRRHLGISTDVGELLRHVRLDDQRDKALSQLSGGQLQRVGLLVALLKEAQLILLDEPTSGVDARFSSELYQVLRDLADGGRSILVITHQLADLLPFADRVLRLRSHCVTELPRELWQGGVL